MERIGHTFYICIFVTFKICISEHIYIDQVGCLLSDKVKKVSAVRVNSQNNHLILWNSFINHLIERFHSGFTFDSSLRLLKSQNGNILNHKILTMTVTYHHALNDFLKTMPMPWQLY